MKYMPSFLLKSFLIITLSFIGSQSALFAAGPPLEVTAGDQSVPVWIYWEVVGGSGTCQGNINLVDPYPNLTSDNVLINWIQNGQDKPALGGMSFSKFYADPGPIGGYHDYNFICKDRVSSAQDQITIRLKNPCSTGQTWDTSTGSCKTPASASFSPVANPACYIPTNSSGCIPQLSWSSSGVSSVWLTDCGNGIYGQLGSGAQSANVWTPYNSGCYLIQHGGAASGGTLSGGTELARQYTASECTSGTTWNGSLCVPLTCSNLAINPLATPSCTQCSDGQYYNTSTGKCADCDNGGCTGTGGTTTDPLGPLVCINGSSDVPTCTPAPDLIPGVSFKVNTVDDPSHIVNGTSLTTSTNIASGGETVRFSWPSIARATSCTLNGSAVSVSGGTSDVIATGWSGNSKNFTLSCSNPGKTVSDTITVSYPVAPSLGTSPLTCATDGQSATIVWSTGGLPTYTTRAYEQVGSGPQTEITDTAIRKNSYSGPTTLTFAIDPKGPLSSSNTSRYTVDVYSQASNGALSPKASALKQCARPLPAITLTPTTKNGGTSGSAYYDEPSTTAYLSWTATPGVTSCTLKNNSGTIATGLSSVMTNQPLPAGDTKNNVDTKYDLTCSNSTGNTTESVHVIVPPAPTPTVMDNCPSPYTQGKIKWTYPSSYTRGHYNVIQTNEHAAETVKTCGGQPHDFCQTDYNGTNFNFTAALGETYTWWIRTQHGTNVNYSNAVGDTFTCNAPDLKAGPIITGASQLITETMTSTPFEAYISNTGSIATPSSFKSFIQISDTSSGNGPYHDIAPGNIRALAANGDYDTISSSYTFPTAGTYAVRACADKASSGDSGTIVESDEGNNCGPWATITVQSLPKVTIDPSTDINPHYPKTPLTIDSLATDADSNLIHHDIYVTVGGVTYTGVQSGTNGTVSLAAGTNGSFSSKGSNNYSMVFTPSHPGTYTIEAKAKESIYTNFVTKQITVTVACHNNEWWNNTDCVKPTATVVAACSNGAINPTECNICAPTAVFYNGRCINAGICYSEHYNLRPFSCGNGVVDSGEECDGTAGLSNPASQKCTAKCTITCATGVSALYGAPSCGAGTGKVFTSSNGKVNACINGALQSSAPNCDVCPNGETPVIDGQGKVTLCKAPVCGNNSTENNTTEECDGSSGVPTNGSKFCTSNCCLVNTQPRLSETEQIPTYTLKCENSDLYEIRNSVGTLVKSGTYIPGTDISFKPTAKDTYTYKCLYSGNPAAIQETVVGTNLPSDSNMTGRTTLNASPKSISKNSSVTLSWITTSPDNQCSVRATPVITRPSTTCNEQCIADRYRESNRINSDLRLGVTDKNDLGIGNNTRPILDAMQKTPTEIPGATKAVGKKTVNLNYSTLFYASCSANPIADPNASKIKVSVVGDSEN